MKLRRAFLLRTVLALVLFLPVGGSSPKGFKVKVLRTLDHVGAPFTQGLQLINGNQLLETSGAFPAGTESMIRILDLSTGNVVRETKAGLEGRFAEGVAPTPDGFLVTTYQDHKAVKFTSNLDHVGDMYYPWNEGWGLAQSSAGSSYYATNGSEFVMELNSKTLEVERMAPAKCLGQVMPGLNELELVQDFGGRGPTLFGNLYKTRLVLGIDPKTFECTSVFDLTGLGEYDPMEYLGYHVANGLAYLPDSGNFMVTGKNWQKMFEISVDEEDSSPVQRLRQTLGQDVALLQGQIRHKQNSQINSQIPEKLQTEFSDSRVPETLPSRGGDSHELLRKERPGKAVLGRGQLEPFGGP